MKDRNQRQNRNRVAVGAVLFLLVLVCLPVRAVRAASATITLTAKEEEIRVGDTVEIRLTIKADAVIGDFEAFINYDDSVLEFYSAVSCITGGAGFLRVADVGASPSEQDRTYRIYFKAIAQGDCEIAIYDRPVVYGYNDGVEMSVTGVSKLFSVLPAEDASSDSRLSALYLVDNHTQLVALTPVFSTGVTEYYAAVPYESESLIVSAIASDEKAEVEVLGGQELNFGNNEVLITVTAENSSKTVYTIYVYRAEVPTQESEETLPTEKPVMPESGIAMEQEDGQTFVTEYHTYTVCDKPEAFLVPDGYIETSLKIGEIETKAYAKQGAEEFLLLVLQNEAGEVNWYCYDRVEQTLQRVKQEEFVVTQIIEKNEEALQEAIDQYQIQQMGLSVVIAFVSGICFVLLMVILWLCVRQKNRG